MGLGYRFKSFDAARAMANANPNEVSYSIQCIDGVV